MPFANYKTSVPVIVDADKCIANKGCRVCVHSMSWSSMRKKARPT